MHFKIELYKVTKMKDSDLEKDLLKDEDFEDFKSQYNNCYVYEMFVKATGEIFYVGRDSEEERDEPFDVFSPLYKGWADRISKRVETEKRILKTGLRESVANHYVLKRIEEIKNDNMLCDRQNCAFWDDNTIQIGVSPKLEVCPIERHYLGKTAISFDKVVLSNLTTVYLDTSFLAVNELYGNRYEEYYNELIQKLEAIGAKIVKSQYAKSIKAWIYLGRIIQLEYEKVQERAINKLGRNIPAYHIFDVLNALKDVVITPPPDTTLLDIEIHPIHNRCPLSAVRNMHDWRAAYQEGSIFAQKGEEFRLQGDIENAILYFDKARECGLNVYDGYAKAYRKIKDYDNEIAILIEWYERYQMLNGNNRTLDGFFVELKEKINKAKKRLIQSKNK